MVKSLKALITLVVFTLTTGLALAEGKYQTVVFTDGSAVLQTNTKTGEMRFCFPSPLNISAKMHCSSWSAPAK